MKTFTTSIFVPSKSRHQMNAMEIAEMGYKISNRSRPITDELGTGALDDLQGEEQFILIVNGEKEKHEIKMKALTAGIGKTRLMVTEPDNPIVSRFLEWRIDSAKRMTQHNRTSYQLKNFTIEDLRRLIRTAHAQNERRLVAYR